MSVNEKLEAVIIQRRHRVPVPAGPPAGDGAPAARQLDAVLMSVGFKLSGDLLTVLSSLDTGFVLDLGVRVLAAVRELVGDHARHNTYFRDFPAGVPDTVEFWAQCLAEALLDPVTAGQVEGILIPGPQGHIPVSINLLSLPTYGRYQHAYEDMLAAHEPLIESAKDRVTVLHQGSELAVEGVRLFHELAGSKVPLAGGDLELLAGLAKAFVHEQAQPEIIPVRENRAVINEVRVRYDQPLLADTVTDVLRLAARLSGGDVTLAEDTRFRSLRRAERLVLLEALDRIVSSNAAKLSDVSQYAEPWKRLGGLLHYCEYPQFSQAARVFATARGEECHPSFASQVEAAFTAWGAGTASTALQHAPGMYMRTLDRLLRSCDSASEVDTVMTSLGKAVQGASGRVLLSVREHLQNRVRPPGTARIFVNRRGRAWVTPDVRTPIDTTVVAVALYVIDAEVAARLRRPQRHLVVDPEVLGAALPLSQKTVTPGLGIMPRGSVSAPLSHDRLRFFVHWMQAERRTDYDLSAMLLNETFTYAGHVSYTNLRGDGIVHSGDITDAPAPEGASEFIDVNLKAIPARYLVPSILLYSGEAFTETAESFCGYMLRDAAQEGQPFEPRTVRAKSDMRGPGRVAMPLVVMRGDDGRWRVKWTHLYAKGQPAMNRVEDSKLSTPLLMRSIVERDYLRVDYVVQALSQRAETVSVGSPDTWREMVARNGEPVTYIGLDQPEGLPEGSEVYTLNTLASLIPA
jgi:hypothetical protein